MATYFGETTPGASWDTFETSTSWFRNKNKTYTCPGSGNQSLTELSAYVRTKNGNACHIRLAIYDTSNNLIYQMPAEVLVTGAGGWIGQTGITGVTLVGGTNYRIACSFDTPNDIDIAYNAESLGDHTSEFNVEYTGGWPSTLADSGDDDWVKSVRAGVDPAGGDTALSASVSCVCVVSSILTTIIQMAASISCAATAAAQLTTLIGMAASAACSCAVSAELTTETASTPLSASAVCACTVAAELTTAIAMGANISIGAAVVANLYEKPQQISQSGGSGGHKRKKQESAWMPWAPPEEIKFFRKIPVAPEEDRSVQEAERIVAKYQKIIDDTVVRISDNKKKETARLTVERKQREREYTEAKLALEAAHLNLTIAIEQEEEAVMAAVMAVLHYGF